MKSVLATSAFVAVLMMIGRLLGFVRELLLGASFGPTETADAAIVLLTLPDLFVTLLLAGGFGAALIPALKRADEANRITLTRRVALWTLLAFALLAAGLALAPQMLLSILAPSLDIAQVRQFQAGFVLSAVALPLVAIAGVMGAYLNAKAVFGVPTMGVIAYNIVLCAYLGLIAPGATGLLGLSIAILVAVALRLAMHFMAAPELFGTPALKPNGGDKLDAVILKRFAIGVATSGLVFAVPLIFRAVYAAEGDGLLTLFNFAQKMLELPSGILIAPVVTVMLPKLSALALSTDTSGQQEFDRTFSIALTATISIATSAAVVAVVFAKPLAELLFLHGAMTPSDVGHIADIAAVFMVGLPFIAAQQIAAAALNAEGRPKTVAVSAFVALLFALGASMLLAPVLPAVTPAPVLGVVLFQVIMAAANLWSLRAFHHQIGPLIGAILRTTLRSALTILPFAVPMVFWGEGIGRWLGTGLAGLAFAALLAANAADLKPLRSMRSGQV